MPSVIISSNSMFIIINPAYTIMCKNPATGLLTIFDWPKETRNIFSHLFFFWSLLSISLPSKIFLLRNNTFLLKNQIEKIKRIVKIIFGMYVIIKFGPIYLADMAFVFYQTMRTEHIWMDLLLNQITTLLVP